MSLKTVFIFTLILGVSACSASQSSTDNHTSSVTSALSCTAKFNPVCGNDGRTYGNSCYAKLNGVNSNSEGKCPPTLEPIIGKICGQSQPRLSTICDAPREYCHREAKDMCGATEVPGRCRVRPDTCADVLAPVCGCDGKTYGNSCYANSKGVSVKSNGKCPS